MSEGHERETLRQGVRYPSSMVRHTKYRGSSSHPDLQYSHISTDRERYAGWAAGAQHTALYSRLSSINSEGVAMKVAQLEGAEDGETFASGCLQYQRL
ncbi:MAG: hypothetical protein Ct9H90mP23_2650 [Methanobacteriota archaeon]|nr:MAG: hypothetical protein Ct9H90mP23_2650 [Euryarchaeota archaeon]